MRHLGLGAQAADVTQEPHELHQRVVGQPGDGCNTARQARLLIHHRSEGHAMASSFNPASPSIMVLGRLVQAT